MAGKQILVIEPSAAEWEFMRDIFKYRGDEAQWAKSTTAGLELFRARDFDLVLIEVLLPRGSGFALCEKIKADEKCKNIPVLMMGGVLKNFKFAHDARVKYRANDILVKPFDPHDLERKLALYLDGVILKDDGQRVDATTGELIREIPESETIRINGLLTGLLLPRLLAAFWELEETGILHVQRGHIHKRILFQKGAVIYVGGGSRKECLQQILLDREIIDEKTITSSLNRMIDTGKLQGEALMELGVLNPHDLFLMLTAQAEQKLLNTFSWREGRFWFEPMVDVAPPGMVPLPLDLGKLLRAGIEANVTAAALEELYANKLNLGVHRIVGGLTRLERLNPSAAEKKIWMMMDGQKTVAMLLANGELPPPATYRLLFLLEIVGAVAFAAPARVPETQGWPPLDPLGRSTNPQDVAFHEFVQQKFVDAYQRELLQVLQVPPEAPLAEMDVAYLRACAGLLDEQRFPHADDITQAKARAAFYRLSEAFEMLSDPIQRTLHEQALAAATDERESNNLQAELQFQKGLAAFGRGDYLEAADRFEAAIEAHSRTAEYHAYMGYTLYLRDNERGPMTQSLAIERIKRALNIDPQIPEAHLFLGHIYFFAGKLDKAETAYEKTIRYDPDNFEAHQRLWQIEAMRQAAAAHVEQPHRSPELQEYQEIIQEYFQRLGVWDYYELLGVERDVNASDLRRAYFQLSQQLRPAAMKGLIDPLIFEKADEIFQRLTVAYTTLSDARERSEYDRLLAAGALEKPAAASPEQISEAADLHEEGRQAAQKGDFKSALGFFQRAYQLDPQEATNLAWLGWAVFQASGLTGLTAEKARAQAKVYLRQALNRDPACVEACVFLGQIYLGGNKNHLARERFENALRTEPTSLVALQGYRRAVKGQAIRPELEVRPNDVQKLLAAEYQTVSEQNLFDRLGVSRQADSTHVQTAYQRAVEKYVSEEAFVEPDPISQRLVDDLVDLYTMALQILSHGQLREGYIQALNPMGFRQPKLPETKAAAPAPIETRPPRAETKPSEVRPIADWSAAAPKKEKDFWRLIKEKLKRQ